MSFAEVLEGDLPDPGPCPAAAEAGTSAVLGDRGLWLWRRGERPRAIEPPEARAAPLWRSVWALTDERRRRVVRIAEDGATRDWGSDPDPAAVVTVDPLGGGIHAVRWRRQPRLDVATGAWRQDAGRVEVRSAGGETLATIDGFGSEVVPWRDGWLSLDERDERGERVPLTYRGARFEPVRRCDERGGDPREDARFRRVREDEIVVARAIPGAREREERWRVEGEGAIPRFARLPERETPEAAWERAGTAHAAGRDVLVIEGEREIFGLDVAIGARTPPLPRPRGAGAAIERPLAAHGGIYVTAGARIAFLRFDEAPLPWRPLPWPGRAAGAHGRLLAVESVEDPLRTLLFGPGLEPRGEVRGARRAEGGTAGPYFVARDRWLAVAWPA